MSLLISTAKGSVLSLTEAGGRVMRSCWESSSDFSRIQITFTSSR